MKIKIKIEVKITKRIKIIGIDGANFVSIEIITFTTINHNNLENR